MSICHRLIFAVSLLLVLAACKESSRTDAPVVRAKPIMHDSLVVPADGCYHGSSTSGGDSISVQLRGGSGSNEINGEMIVTIPEKDRRSGTLHGKFDANGIVRATYYFMQEGVRDSIRVQFAQDARGMRALRLRPSAYESRSGREYPDTSTGFSIILKPVPCDQSAFAGKP